MIIVRYNSGYQNILPLSVDVLIVYARVLIVCVSVITLSFHIVYTVFQVVRFSSNVKAVRFDGRRNAGGSPQRPPTGL